MKFSITSILTASAALLLGSLAMPARADILYSSNPTDNSITKITSNGVGLDLGATGIIGPSGLAFDSAGSLYIANDGNNTIKKFTAAGVASLFATGGSLFASTGLNQASGQAFDSVGNLYVANNGDNTIEKFTPGGVGSLWATTGLNQPRGLAFDSAGNLYAANAGNDTIEKFTLGGVGSVFASTSSPYGLAFDSAGNLYAANRFSNTIAKFTPGGVGSVFANTSTGLSSPKGLAFDSAGILYVANSGDNSIKKFTPGGVGSGFAFVNHTDFLAFTNDAGVPLPLANQAPEPTTFVLLAIGAVAFLTRSPRRRRQLGNVLSFTLLAGLLLTSVAKAQTIWNVTNGDWNTASNWNPSILPTSSTTVRIGTTTSNRTANIASANAFSTGASIGFSAGQIGTVNVLNGLTWTNGGGVTVGNSGSGTLTIQSASTVRSSGGNIGAGTGSTGAVTVTDTGSTWNGGTSDLTVGGNGNGTLNIQSGGSATAGRGFIGNGTGNTGAVTVNGTASALNLTTVTIGGNSGFGTLDIQAGGSVTNTGSATVGFGTLSTGTVTVDGTGSTWNLGSNLLTVGSSGSGTLIIQAGGVVNSTGGTVGANTGSIGIAVVTGTGSTWNLGSDPFNIGGNGSGTLTVSSGGTVTAANTGLGSFGGTGTLNLNGTAGSRGVLETTSLGGGNIGGVGKLNFNGGILRATGNSSNFLQLFQNGDIQVQSGGAFLDTQSFNVGISRVLQGVGGITKQGTGTLTLSGASIFTGPSTVQAGILSMTGSVTSDVTVQSGGTLAGTGTVKLVTLQSGAKIAPGVSGIGTLSTQGEVWNGGGSYLWDIGAATGTAGTAWDLINVTGSLNVAATSADKFTVGINGNLTGIAPQSVLDWKILTASGGFTVPVDANAFLLDRTNFSSNVGGNFSLITQGNDLVLRYAATPEPTTLALAAMGSLALLGRNTRRRRD